MCTIRDPHLRTGRLRLRPASPSSGVYVAHVVTSAPRESHIRPEDVILVCRAHHARAKIVLIWRTEEVTIRRR